MQTEVAVNEPGLTGEPRRERKGRPTRTALTLGIAMLSRREYSRYELRTKLRQSKEGFAADDIEAALERLTEEKWQSDLRFAQALVRMRGNSGYGPLRIRNELQTHRISSEEVADAMSQFDGKWEAIACEWVERRYGAAMTPRNDGDSYSERSDREVQLAVLRKAADFLTRRGFDYATMRAAVAVLHMP